MMKTVSMSFSRMVLIGTGWFLAGGSDLPAEFFPVETFSTLSPGAIHGQNNWRDPGGSAVVTTDPDHPTDQVVAITNDSAVVSRPLAILNDSVRMLFLRFRFSGLQNYSFGMSDSTFPAQFDDFEVEIGMSNAQSDLRVNNGGQYDVLASLASNRWYYLWIVVDNVEDQFQVYLHSRPDEDAEPADQQQSEGVTTFDFRNRSARDLRTFFIKTGGGSSQNVGPLYLDDIYVETTSDLNLSNPIVSPPIWMISPQRQGDDLAFEVVGDCADGCRILQSSSFLDWNDTGIEPFFSTPRDVVISNAFSSPEQFFRVVTP
jgi:hypothetical protein